MTCSYFRHQVRLDLVLRTCMLALIRSGTTGNPKPIFKSHRAYEVWRRMVETTQRSPASLKIAMFDAYIDSYNPIFLPLSWSATVTLSAIAPILTGSVPIFMPGSWKQPASPAQIYEALPLIPRSRHNSILFIPDILREFVRLPERLDALKQFDVVMYAGAGLDRATGDTIWEKTGVRVQSNMGSTDSDLYPTVVQHDPAQWYVHRLHPDCEGFHFQHYTEDLYELCITRQPNDTRHCFITEPQRTVSHTRDLFRKVNIAPRC